MALAAPCNLVALAAPCNLAVSKQQACNSEPVRLQTQCSYGRPYRAHRPVLLFPPAAFANKKSHDDANGDITRRGGGGAVAVPVIRHTPCYAVLWTCIFVLLFCCSQFSTGWQTHVGSFGLCLLAQEKKGKAWPTVRGCQDGVASGQEVPPLQENWRRLLRRHFPW